MAGSMHWTSKFRTLKWLQRMLMCAKTLQKTLAVFPLAWLWKAVTSDSGTGETTSDEQQQVLLSALSLVSGCWSAHCLLSSGDGSTPFRAGHYWWPPWGSHVQCTVWQVCTLYLGAAMFRVWQRAQSGGRGLKSSNLQSLSSWISPLASPP